MAHSFVFIHGLYMTKHSWQPWVDRFQRLGHEAQAIAWPGRDRSPEELRRSPDPELGRRTLAQVIDHHEAAIRALPAPPVIVGHSMGGLITQVLLQRGLGAAGVAIDSAPPRGVVTLKWSFLKANWPALNFLRSGREPYVMPFEDFQYAFVNGMEIGAQRAIYEREAVPESLTIARGALTSTAQIDFARQRAPLLLLAGSTDTIIPASLNQSNYRKYRVSPAVTDFKEFAGRNHFGVGAPGWEVLADYVLEWADRVAGGA
ncbi:MAG TPA: alpha/beta fold hydrolase [Herpetosiphonaceae bacterium]